MGYIRNNIQFGGDSFGDESNLTHRSHGVNPFCANFLKCGGIGKAHFMIAAFLPKRVCVRAAKPLSDGAGVGRPVQELGSSTITDPTTISSLGRGRATGGRRCCRWRTLLRTWRRDSSLQAL